MTKRTADIFEDSDGDEFEIETSEDEDCVYLAIVLGSKRVNTRWSPDEACRIATFIRRAADRVREQIKEAERAEAVREVLKND